MKKQTEPQMPLPELYDHDTFKEAPTHAKIRLIRMALGWTQEQLGLKMNPPVDRKRVSKIESKPINLRIDTIQQIASGLGVDESRLL